MAIDFTIRNVRLPHSVETTDIGVEGGLIAAIEPALSATRPNTTPAVGSSAEA